MPFLKVEACGRTKSEVEKAMKLEEKKRRKRKSSILYIVIITFNNSIKIDF